MRYAKYLGAAGLLAVAIGTILTAVGAIGPSLRLIGLGAAVAFGGLTMIHTGSLLAQRRQVRSLDLIRRRVGARSGPEGDLERLIRSEVGDIARIVDARILGLLEMREDD